MAAESLRDSSNAALLEAAKQGDAAAWGQLVESYRAYLMSVAKCNLQERQADEWSSVVQEGLLRAWGQFHQFRGATPRELLAWLAMIVRNKARDRRRGNSAAAPLPDEARELLLAADASPSSHAMRRERGAQLMVALERLPADYRQVTELRFFQNLSHDQIAQRMKRSNDAVRSLLVRALRQLRGELEPES